MDYSYILTITSDRAIVDLDFSKDEFSKILDLMNLINYRCNEVLEYEIKVIKGAG